MLTFTDKALEMVRSFLDQAGDEAEALRISRKDGSPLASEYDLTLISRGEQRSDDRKIEIEDLLVLVEGKSVDALTGATVDFVERVNARGFEVRTAQRSNGSGSGSKPRAATAPAGPIADRVKEVLDTQVNPGIAAHGGMISLVEVDGTEIYLEMSGGCQGCALSRMTLRQGVERMVRQQVPEVTVIHDVTDHASGENPYYSG